MKEWISVHVYKNIRKSIINKKKIISKICLWYLLKLVSCHFMMLISETLILWKAVPSQFCQFPGTTSGEEKKEVNWSEWFLLKVYIVVCYFFLIILSTVELTSFATRFARLELYSLLAFKKKKKKKKRLGLRLALNKCFEGYSKRIAYCVVDGYPRGTWKKIKTCLYSAIQYLHNNVYLCL